MDRSWWRVLTKRGPLKKGIANRFSILALRTMNRMKRQKDRTLKDELPRSLGAKYAWNYRQRFVKLYGRQ